ncbi:MAG: ABC transporter substrate-binding protein [Alphaproteobacteria bacterium]
MTRLKRIGMAAGLVAAALSAGPSLHAEDIAVDHRWGRTVLTEPAERIVTLSYTGIDTLLALGIMPIAYRTWYGGDERGLWPWAAAHLPVGATGLPLKGEIDPEAVARLNPDLVEASYSGISRAQYAALSHVTAVLPPPEGRGDFGTPWDEMLRIVGKATGRGARAQNVIEAIESRIDAVRRAHPDWQGKTAVVARLDGPLIFSEMDPRMKLISRLGFQLPDTANALALNNFYFKLDRELTEPLDADVVIWLDFAADRGSLDSHPLRHALRAFQEGREIFLGPGVSAALNYASALSIPYALDRLVPMLEAALDGDPATVVPDARKGGPDS